MPLLLVPYLLRVLGLGPFGEWALAMSFVAVCRTVVTFGFDLTATRAGAVYRDNKAYLSSLVGAVLLVRLTFLGACFVAVAALAIAVDNIRSILPLTLVGLSILIGEALFPQWLFQAIERMATVTKVRLISKGVFVVLVFAFVDGPGDVLLIPALEASCSLVAGTVALGIARFGCGVTAALPSRELIVEHVRDGGSVFVSLLTVHLYTTVNVILLGALGGATAAGQYAVAERIYSAVRGMTGPIVQALFPRLSRLHADDQTRFRQSAQRIALYLTIILGIAAVALYAVASPLVALVAGSSDETATSALRILALSLACATGTFLSPLLIIRARHRRLFVITVCSAVLNVLIAFPLVQLYGAVGAAVSFSITQACQAALQISSNADVLLPRSARIQGAALPVR